MPVEATREHLDAPSAESITAIPVISCDGVQLTAQDAVIDLDVLGVGGMGEKPMKAVVRVQMAGGGELEPRQCDMCGIEIDGGDAGWIGEEIAQHVAAARRDRDDAATRLHIQRFEIDDRILPN